MADLEAGRVFDAEEVFDDVEAAIREIERRKGA
jgi:predicted transcriptional regulator